MGHHQSCNPAKHQMRDDAHGYKSSCDGNRLTALPIQDGFYRKRWGRGTVAHKAIGDKALCGVGDVTPVAYNAHMTMCARCERVAAAYIPTAEVR